VNNIIGSFKILDVVEQEDGTAIINIDLGDEFITWFCEHHGLEKFDEELFQDWFVDSLTQGLEKVKENG